MNFSAIQAAGLSQGQFAAMLGVTRITVNNWVKGRFNVNENLKPKADRLLTALDAAVADGDLPVPPATEEPERTQKIKAAIVKHLPSKALGA